MRLSLVLAALATFGASACASSVSRSPDDRAAPEREPVGETSSAVIKGTASPASQDSVIMIQMGQNGFCSGTLIAPNVVLTARHCVSSSAEDDCGTLSGDMAPSTLGIAVGASANERSTPVAHAKKYFYGAGKDLCVAGDFALILLDKSITTAAPSKVRAAPATVGEEFVAVGYGEDENKQVSVRRQRTGVKALAIGPAKETFTPSNAAPFTYEIPAGEIATSEAVCHGDSGGPLFDLQGRVVAMTSRGADPNDVCVARPDIFTAVAAHLDVVDQALKEAGFPRDTSEDPTKPSTKDAPNGGGDDVTANDTDAKGDDETTVTKKVAKKKAVQLAAPAGCAVSRAPGGESDGYGEGGVVVVLIGLVLAMRGRRSRQ